VPEIERGSMYKPYQKPRPEIVGTVVAPFSKGVIAMGERDFHPLSANFLLEQWLPSHWTNYVEGKKKAGQVAKPEEWRVARTIFVADDDKVALRYGRQESQSPYRYYWKMLLKKMMLSKRHAIFKTHQEQDDAELTDDYMVDRLVICGSVDKVVDDILSLRERVGDFGEIVYANMDWVDAKLAKRSMELMATEVMPRVNAAIGTAQKRARTV
jgi:alkanesulfonate monooxygenase SsuD/methylene tetrahydromethanopterin reductase-like flavin-dependent oxidoreductase (luciferase family)